jgi:hypothetical protein
MFFIDAKPGLWETVSRTEWSRNLAPRSRDATMRVLGFCL